MFRLRLWLRIMFGLRLRIMFRLRLRIMFRLRLRFRIMFRLRLRFRIMFRLRLRFRIRFNFTGFPTLRPLQALFLFFSGAACKTCYSEPIELKFCTNPPEASNSRPFFLSKLVTVSEWQRRRSNLLTSKRA